ncbi:MAG: hypothetical protein JNM66_21670 [Bryobacterales bacterium]|nr:hypothetical protein [Bryobacterales bacterium]
MRKVPHCLSLAIANEWEDDGRWLADIPALPGVTADSTSKRLAAYLEGLRKRQDTKTDISP